MHRVTTRVKSGEVASCPHQRQFRSAALWIAVILTVGLAAGAPPAAADGGADRVVVQLRWDHQFQFAGYYAAQWEGHYDRAGFEVETRSAIRRDGTIRSAVSEVVEGRADFGIGAADVLLACDGGADLVVVATILQQSAAAFYALKGTGLDTPADFTRLRVARKVDDLIDVELQALLHAEGIDPATVTPYPHQMGIDHLLRGDVDVIPGYEISAAFQFQLAGIPVETLRPADYGIAFYGDSLFTRRDVIDRDPARVERFVRATLSGWRYAMENRDAVIDRIARTLPRVRPVPGGDIAIFNRFQADAMAGLMLYPVVRLGNSNPERWGMMHRLMKRIGMVSGDLDADRFVFDPRSWRAQARAREERILVIALTIIGGLAILAALYVILLRRTVIRRTRALTEINRTLAAEVAERKAAQAALDESRETFSTFMDHLPCAAFIKDDALQPIYVNRYARELLGGDFPVEPAVDDVFPEAGGESGLQEEDRRVLSGGGPLEIIETLCDPAGEARIFKTIKFPVPRRGGTLGIGGIALDVTDLKRSEARLIRAKRELNAVLDAISKPVIYLDLDHRVIWANRAAADIAGTSPDAFIGMHCREVWCPDEGADPCPDCPVAGTTRTGEVCERELAAEDGQVWLLRAYPVCDDDNGMVGVVVVALDVTDHRRMTQATLLAKKTESFRILAGGIAHDYNNLMTIIFGYISMAREETGPESDIYGYLDAAERACEQCRDLTHQFNKLSEGWIPVHTVDAITGLVRDETERVLSGSGKPFQLDLDPGLHPISHDPESLRHVVRNLVQNADDATADGGTIRVTVKNETISTSPAEGPAVHLAPGAYVRITVADTGRGINPADRDKIFDPYFTTKGKDAHKGVGLGLATAFAIVRKHNGQIAVESDPGKGSRFDVYLPATAPESSAGPGWPLPDGERTSVLVVEDERPVGDLCDVMLTRLGYHVGRAGSLDEAREQMTRAVDAEHPYDLVLVDLTVDGRSAIRRLVPDLRRIDDNVIVVVTSGSPSHPAFTRYADYGFDAAIIKPYTQGELRHTLNAALAARSPAAGGAVHERRSSMETNAILNLLTDPVRILSGDPDLGFEDARDLARAEARKRSDDPMLLSWYVGRTGDFYPRIECGTGDRPAWIVYAESRGGDLPVVVDDGAYVFYFLSVSRSR